MWCAGGVWAGSDYSELKKNTFFKTASSGIDERTAEKGSSGEYTRNKTFIICTLNDLWQMVTIPEEEGVICGFTNSSEKNLEPALWCICRNDISKRGGLTWWYHRLYEAFVVSLGCMVAITAAGYAQWAYGGNCVMFIMLCLGSCCSCDVHLSFVIMYSLLWCSGVDVVFVCDEELKSCESKRDEMFCQKNAKSRKK